MSSPKGREGRLPFKLATEANSWFQRPENAATVPATLAAIAPLALGDVEELVPFGAEVGAFLSVLGYAYLGAWIFNYVIVVLPRKKQLFEAYTAAWPALGMLALEAERVLDDLAYLVEPDNPAYEVTPTGAYDLATRIPVGKLSGSHLYCGDRIALDMLESRLQIVRDQYRSIAQLITLFDHELIIRLTNFANCDLVRTKITQKDIDDEALLLNTATGTLGRNNIGGRFGHGLSEYVKASLSIKEFLDTVEPKPGVIAYGLSQVAFDRQMYNEQKVGDPADDVNT